MESNVGDFLFQLFLIPLGFLKEISIIMDKKHKEKNKKKW